MGEITTFVGDLLKVHENWPTMHIHANELGVVLYVQQLDDEILIPHIDDGSAWAAIMLFEDGGFGTFREEEVNTHFTFTGMCMPAITLEYKWVGINGLIHDWHSGLFDEAFASCKTLLDKRV